VSETNMSRRQWLAAGSAGLLSALFARASSAEEPPPLASPSSARAKSCIVLWMNGGPSHLDTFDPKPGSKSSGPFKAIKTRAPAIQLCEHLPKLAEHADRLAVLRGVSSKEGNHQRAIELAHTGHVPNPTVRAPAIGSWVAKTRPRGALELPSFVSLGGPSLGAGFFGNPYDPFVVSKPGALPDDLRPARPVGPARASARSSFLETLEGGFALRTGDPQVAARREVYAKARTMMASDSVQAFSVADEPAAIVDAYGDTDFGRGCLVARRLVEVGVPFVEVTLDGWDTHEDNFGRVEDRLAILDPAMSALLADLTARGLLDSTLVVWMGEFGRTPRISGDDGRDHHPAAFSVAMAGAGVKPGVVHGETDGDGAAVVKDGVSVPDVVATIAHLTGVDPRTEVTTPTGRPVRVTEKGKPIQAILT
jgi:hypothetical protein